MFIKLSFTTRWYWQITCACNFAKLLGAQVTYYSCGTGSDYKPHPIETRAAQQKLGKLWPMVGEKPPTP